MTTPCCAQCLSKKILGSEDEVLTPELAATRLLQHCKKTTQHSRRWMQENPARRIPEDHTKFVTIFFWLDFVLQRR